MLFILSTWNEMGGNQVEYENYRVNTDLMDLFIDHKGVLIAKDHDYETVYYRNNTVKK